MDEVKQLTEEVFALKYELNTLADVLLRNESERWVPGYLYHQTEHSHIARYQLACNYSAGKTVIDIACGTGKGSHMLATVGNAESVNGFDIQPEAVRYAGWRNANPNVTFDVKNAQELGITDEYNFAVSFETVEHLPDYKAFLACISACLKQDGLFIISTPISAVDIDSKPANPYHVQEWGFLKFQEVVQSHFTIEKVFVQLYPERKLHNAAPQKSLVRRAIDKIGRKVFGTGTVHTSVQPAEVKSNLSTIEEFTGQYDVAEFGTSRIGYQILLLKKKG